MRAMTKSPSRLAREALEPGRKVLPAYSGRFSRRDYSQPQIFAILVLRVFFETDFPGMTAILAEWPALRRTLCLKTVPHYSTLCYAQERLLKEGRFDRLLSAVWKQAQRPGLIDSKPELAIDATGPEPRHVSAHDMNRRGEQRCEQKTRPKLTAVYHTATHLIAGAVAGRGPSSDSSQCPPAIRQAAANVKASRLLGDKGYNSEPIHQLCRDELGIRSTVIPLNPRTTGRRWPKTKYRRQM